MKPSRLTALGPQSTHISISARPPALGNPRRWREALSLCGNGTEEAVPLSELPFCRRAAVPSVAPHSPTSAPLSSTEASPVAPGCGGGLPSPRLLNFQSYDVPQVPLYTIISSFPLHDHPPPQGAHGCSHFTHEISEAQRVALELQGPPALQLVPAPGRPSWPRSLVASLLPGRWDGPVEARGTQARGTQPRGQGL